MTEKKIKENLILSKTFDFALKIIQYAKLLQQNQHYVIANQLLKCGTSIGANCWESQNSESRADFVHKLKIAAKESDETLYWLLLCKHAGFEENNSLLSELETIQKILNKIIHSSKK